MTRPTCPLCAGVAATSVRAYSYEAIWEGLRTEWGASITDATRQADAPTHDVSLVRCDDCGLERFEPFAPGSPAFYEELMAAMPYNDERWEFGVVAGRVRQSDDVLDIGCGGGAFLRSLGTRSGRSAGIDHNADAIDRLAGQGVEAYVVSFDEFARAEAGRFDVVTAFHVLEHIDEPVAAVEAAAACLRPGGRLFVSVPNRERSYRSDAEPLDCPPHHVTRWSEIQLRALADRVGLAVRAVEFEPPDLSVVRELARRKAATRLRRVPGRARELASWAWGKAAIGPRRHGAIARRDGFAARGEYGHAVLAELERTPAPASGVGA
jgi:SAM-dependent methyltransferase